MQVMQLSLVDLQAIHLHIGAVKLIPGNLVIIIIIIYI